VVRIVPKSKRKIVENTQIHDRSHSWPGTSTSIKSGEVKLFQWTQTSPLSEMTQSCKCFPKVNIMPRFILSIFNILILLILFLSQL